MAIQITDKDGDDVSVLDYGINEAEVNKQIMNEEVRELDLNRVPVEVAVENIDKVSKEEFTQLRRTGFGGSDSSVLLGVNPFSTEADLIASKTRTELSEEEKAVGKLAAVRKGNDLEPLIISKATEILKTAVFKPPHMYRFKEFPYLTMNFDGVTDLNGKQYIPIEIKVCTFKGEKHYNKFKAFFNEALPEGEQAQLEQEDISEHNMSIEERAAHYGIPPYYFTQLQQEMMALDAPFGFLAVLFESDWYVRIYKVYKDPKTQNALIIRGYKVWQKVEAIKNKKEDI
jgi:predicted phage-related endonuclease